MKAITILLAGVFYINSIYGQYTEAKNVGPIGGNINTNHCVSDNIVCISVAGEMAVSRQFSAGVFSGTIGYLDEKDSLISPCSTSNIGTMNLPDDIIVFPNPNMGTFSLKIIAVSPRLDVLKITDILGREIAKQGVVLNQGENVFSFFDFIPGFYFLKFETNNFQKPLKVVVR